MTRSLTRAQIERRSAILEYLRRHVGEHFTPDALRNYLVCRRGRIVVTVDTVQRDLRAMEAAGTVRYDRHHPSVPYAGWTCNFGSLIGPVVDLRGTPLLRRVCNACGLGKHCARRKAGLRPGCRCTTCGSV